LVDISQKINPAAEIWKENQNVKVAMLHLLHQLTLIYKLDKQTKIQY